MEELIAQIAQAMAGQNASQTGGATNPPMDPASQKRYASEQIRQKDIEQMRQQAIVDSLLAQLADMPMGQVDPYGAMPNVVGPSGYTRSGAPVEFPRMAPTPTLPQEPGAAGPRTIMHNGQPGNR